MRHEMPRPFSAPAPASAVPTLQNATLPPGRSALVADTTLPYSSGHRAGFCRLRLFAPGNAPNGASRPAVIIATEARENEGLSITNGIEIIAASVCRHYGLNPQHTILIEHYDDRESDNRQLDNQELDDRDQGTAARLPGRIDGEKFSCITFEALQPARDKPGAFCLKRPCWQPLEKCEVESLIGAPLP